jgi:hypothetical protein
LPYDRPFYRFASEGFEDHVTDPITTSKSARESLARGLHALQADPSVPPQLVELAAPIAQAMGALHQIERTQQLAPHADVALNHVRGALAQLQAQTGSHPAVIQALEAVATSLGLVHSLSRIASDPAPQAAPQQPQQQAAPQQPQATPPPRPGSPPRPRQMAQPNTEAVAARPGAATAAVAAPHPTQPLHAQPPPQPAPQQPLPAQPPQPAPQAYGPPPGAQAHQAPPQAQQAPPMVARDPFAAPAAPAPPDAGNLQLINADLGAHSPTNFYKGLSGNDIIDHGGLFISTYVRPKIDAALRVKVSLPGGYEFEANAVVKWTRDDGGADSPPGFGAQFTAITPEARQLVYRYVRNREPIFHDDF